MASQSEEDLSCPVCHDIYKDPVVLSCSHSVCKDCLQKWWREDKSKQCPVCKRRSSRSDVPRNLVLKNLCEAFLLRRDQTPSAESELFCSLHSDKLRLFCLDHQQPVCLVCRDSEIHIHHRFKPIKEAEQHLRKELQESLKPLQDKLKLFEQVKGKCDQTAEHIQVQARHTERQIKEQFKKLHQFLQEEEESRIRALSMELKKKSKRMKEKMETLSREIESLSDTIRSTEEQLRAEDVSFLLKYKAAVERVQQRPMQDDPQLGPGALIDVAKHLGNLSFNIWNNMKKVVSYTPVVLDPNSAHPDLILSEDLTSMSYGERQKLPENPERFDCDVKMVRGSQSFNSGTHSWDVEVGDGTDWALGVMTEPDFNDDADEDVGCLVILYSDGKYEAMNMIKEKETLLKVKQNPHRIRIHLECNKRKLSFYDPDTNVCIHTFKKIYSERLFPVFIIDSEVPITILPQIF